VFILNHTLHSLKSSSQFCLPFPQFQSLSFSLYHHRHSGTCRRSSHRGGFMHPRTHIGGRERRKERPPAPVICFQHSRPKSRIMRDRTILWIRIRRSTVIHPEYNIMWLLVVSYPPFSENSWSFSGMVESLKQGYR